MEQAYSSTAFWFLAVGFLCLFLLLLVFLKGFAPSLRTHVCCSALLAPTYLVAPCFPRVLACTLFVLLRFSFRALLTLLFQEFFFCPPLYPKTSSFCSVISCNKWMFLPSTLLLLFPTLNHFPRLRIMQSVITSRLDWISVKTSHAIEFTRLADFSC